MQDVVRAVRCGKGVSDRECEISETGATEDELYIFVEMCRRYAVLRLDERSVILVLHGVMNGKPAEVSGQIKTAVLFGLLEKNCGFL